MHSLAHRVSISYIITQAVRKNLVRLERREGDEVVDAFARTNERFVVEVGDVQAIIFLSAFFLVFFSFFFYEEAVCEIRIFN